MQGGTLAPALFAWHLLAATCRRLRAQAARLASSLAARRLRAAFRAWHALLVPDQDAVGLRRMQGVRHRSTAFAAQLGCALHTNLLSSEGGQEPSAREQ